MQSNAGKAPTREEHPLYQAEESLSDGEIIAAVRGGNIDEFERIVRRYRPALLRTACSRLGNVALAEDAVQEAFLSAFRSLASYDSKYSFRSWLWTILINHCRREYRRQKRRSTEADTPETAALQCSPEEHVLQCEQFELVCRLLSQLPDEQAEALRLRFFAELKFEEIAAAMNCGLSTAKQRVKTGLEKMSRMLQKNGSPHN